MSNLTYDQQNQMLNTRKINREVGHYFAEKQGDSDKFKAQVELDQRARQRPSYCGGGR
ncbi:MAG: hypothetical protein ABGU93_06810 [Acetobacterium sp.]|uniref:hypothetical protein n=1 Tax=Acetobacterium sp. TaxID=1872094 RepID=UPI003242232A